MIAWRLGIAALLNLAVGAAWADPAQRVVSVGGAVTEIIFALGEGDRVIARDTTSNHPENVIDLPSVGYIRRLSPEGVMATKPDLIIAEEGAGPPEAVDVLNAAAIPIVFVPQGFTPEAIETKITVVADALGVADKGAALAAEVRADLAAAVASVNIDEPRKVLFILANQGGRILAAGGNTAAQSIIELAGAENALDGFEGYKPVGDEALARSEADVILMMDRSGQGAMSDEDIRTLPALAGTPAVQNGNILRMDGMLLLGFSVRTPEAVSALSDVLNES